MVRVFGRWTSELDIVLPSFGDGGQSSDLDWSVLALRHEHARCLLLLLGPDCGVQPACSALIEQSFEHIEVLL